MRLDLAPPYFEEDCLPEDEEGSYDPDYDYHIEQDDPYWIYNQDDDRD